jgi:uncharacterized membrane protein
MAEMSQKREQTQARPDGFHAVLRPYRSLSPCGFVAAMALVASVSVLTGGVFLIAGAWPVTGFFGLDVLLLYLALRLNYRSGRLYETVDLTPARLVWTRVHPSGREEQFDCNPYWARVELTEAPNGQTRLGISAQGRHLVFGRFLTDDERRDFASALRAALFAARMQTQF